MKIDSPTEVNTTLQVYRPASEVLRGLSCKVEVNMYEPSIAMTVVALSRSDPTPGPNHVAFAETDVCTAVDTIILHMNQ